MSWLALLLLLAACGKPASDIRDRRPDTDVDADTDADTDTDSDADTDSDTDADTDADPVPSGDPLPDPPLLDFDTLSDLTDAIDDLFVGETHGAYVIDLDNGEVVYESNADLPLKPASNTKLFTTAAAMGMLGEEARHRVAAYASSAPNGAGEVASLTVLVEHDPSWTAYVYEDEFFAADRLADALWEAGLRRITGTLTLTGEILVDGYSLGTYDADDHRAYGIVVLEDALELRGITVGATATRSSFDTPAGIVLAERESPPLHVLAWPINVYSHNEMSDILTRHDGLELAGGSTYAEGEVATFDFLSGVGIDTSLLNFEDGSGLSHDNRVTARSIVELQLAMRDQPAGQAWERSFSIGGVVGTLGSRLSGADTLGRVYGKSGSLYDTITLSGILYNRHTGHRYLFSLLLNDVENQTSARALLDDVVEVLAVDLRGRGARPAPPVLTSALHAEDGSVVLSWSAVDGATGYAVWRSDDGRVWDRDQAVYIEETTAVLVGDRTIYARVAALNSQGESEPSDVLAATPGSALPTVLIVDGNDRWDDQPENPLGEGHDFVRSVAEVVGRPVDSVANEAVADGTVDLADYDAVIWLLGEESSTDLTFDPDERQAVADYLGGGGNLLVSGAEIGWDLEWLGDADAQAFYADWLRASYDGDSAETFSAVPVGEGLFDGIGELGFYTPGRLQVYFPDQIVPVGGAVAELEYVGGFGGTAAIRYEGAYRLVHLGFPVEAIDTIEQREAIVQRSLEFFGL